MLVQEDASAQTFLQLVADPLRWQLLRELARSDRRVHELTDRLSKPQNLVSYHLRELRKADLVSARRSSADGRDTYYRVDLDRCGAFLCRVGLALQPGLRLAITPAHDQLPTGGRSPRVLFLCTGNSARSQMAEALLEHLSDHTIEARSAGSHPKTLHPNAVRVMRERGIDIAERPTKHLCRFARMRFSQVVTLCDRLREVCPEFPHQPDVAHWSMPDPTVDGDDDNATYPAFQRTAQELESRIGFLIPQLTARAEGQETPQ